MEKMLVLSGLLLVIVLLESGSCFLFKRSSDQDSGDSIAHLKSRYWNDPDQSCIEKFCMPHAGKHSYLRCLQKYCPSAVLTATRDVADDVTLSVALLLGDTEFCRDDFLPIGRTSLADYDSDCVSGRCDGDNTLAGDNDVTVFKYGVYKLCRTILCKDVQGAASDNCVLERCCGQAQDTSTRTVHTHKRTTLSNLASSDERMVRERRQNAEWNQCIRSYCHGRKGSERGKCIYDNCHRA